MTAAEKKQLYAQQQAHAQAIADEVAAKAVDAEASLKETEKKFAALNNDVAHAGDKIERASMSMQLLLERRLYENKKAQLGDLRQSSSAPYFFRCDVMFPGRGAEQTVYFGKHSFTDRGIYSWVSPASALRFEDPGEASYGMPDGTRRSASLSRKDQYHIVDGRILFMATEGVGRPRELVHQEKFSSRKSGFVLPDIVAQMEKAQDAVIRAPHKGSFLIAGPAGSGKTTLALHRVAYLAQNPDTAKHFPDEDVIVFVQDDLAKKYFGALLGELGMSRATIATFHEWALRLLKMPEWRFASSHDDDERMNDEYLFAKKRVLSSFDFAAHDAGRDPFLYLERAYGFTGPRKKMLAAQRDGLTLDRFDIAMLLRRQACRDGKLYEEVEYWDLVRGKMKKKISRNTVRYALVIVDEAENWLAEELRIVRGCVDPDTQAVVYVGDLAQRTQLGTIRSWDEAEERFSEGRAVTLHKVYRNTRQILEYAASLGYAVDVPDGIAEGPAVVRTAPADEAEYCREVVAAAEEGAIVGILAKGAARIKALREEYSGNERVKVLTAAEAQGLEFDTVLLLGQDDFAKEVAYDDPALAEERLKMDHDLLYVALTRAMRELHAVN